MYRNTRFGEILKGLSRGQFQRLAAKHQADKYSKGFRSWDQLVTMVYAQLSGCRSLRDLEVSFNNQAMHHYHLGCRDVKRSTLADANGKRDAAVFLDTCQLLMQQVNRKLRQEAKDFLYLLDSSSITLKGYGYDQWTLENSTRNTQGIKLHLLLNTQTQTPHYVNITAANVNDISDASNITIESEATYVFDKGYCDYNWWHEINSEEAIFVTRFKKNAALITLEEHDISESQSGTILSDKRVKFKNKRPRAKHINHYQEPLRRIVVARPDHDEPLILATNDFDRRAEEIAECYKQRWGIELFFKWIKQNLKIKSYLGKTENAVLIQIATALISYLLVALYRHTQQMKSSMKEVLILVRSSLFQRPETEQYLHRKRRRSHQDALFQQQGILL
jgi:IS4 transposase